MPVAGASRTKSPGAFCSRPRPGLCLATGFAQTGDSSYLSKLPAGDRRVWRSARLVPPGPLRRRLARSILGTFYSPRDNLFFTSASTPQDRDLAGAGKVNVILTADGQTANPVQVAIQ